MATAGLGAISHLCGLLFMTALDTTLNTIPYKGTGPAMNDLLGGQVDLLRDQTSQTVPLNKENRVKVWHGMCAPKGTPAPVIDKVNTALRVALQDPIIKHRFKELSLEVPPLDKVTPAGLRPTSRLKFSNGAQ